MTEKLTEFPFLQVTPPLLLKDAGFSGPRLVQLSEGTALNTIEDNYVVAQLPTEEEEIS